MLVDVLNKLLFLLQYLPLTVKETVQDAVNPLVSMAVYAMLCEPSLKEDPDGEPLRLQEQKERGGGRRGEEKGEKVGEGGEEG